MHPLMRRLGLDMLIDDQLTQLFIPIDNVMPTPVTGYPASA